MSNRDALEPIIRFEIEEADRKNGTVTSEEKIQVILDWYIDRISEEEAQRRLAEIDEREEAAAQAAQKV